MGTKLNHFVCPNYGHDFYAEGACVSCDACQRVFYASESMTCKAPDPRLPRLIATTSIYLSGHTAEDRS